MKQTNNFTRRTAAMLAVLITMLMCGAAAFAQSSAFTYQGRLSDQMQAASGAFDFEFALYDANGIQLDATNTRDDVSVSNGVFTVRLDFGGDNFPGPDRFLEIRVRRGAETGAFTTLTPRQPITAAPYAIQSLNATNAANAANLGGAAANNYLRTNGSGANLINLNASSITAGILDDARLSPNVALRNTANSFTGDQTVSGSFTQTGATTRLNLTNGFVTIGTFNSGTIPLEGAGTRMMFYPGKAAFRAGSVNGTQWNDDNIGTYSAAFGENTRAIADHSFAAGKFSVAASFNTVALGEGSVATGSNSVALGTGADTSARQGSFVFADRSVPLVYDANGNPHTSNSTFFRASVNHSASWRVSGGFRIFTSSNLSTGVTIQSGAITSNWCSQTNAVISTSTCAYLSTGGVWTNASSRDLKTNFARVNPRVILQKVLSLPIQTWSYKSEAANIRHIGAVAQDFKQAFDFGDTDKAIGTVDADGVALAAIQGIYEEMRDELKKRDAKIEQQQKQIDELKQIVCAVKPDAAVCQK